MSEQPPRIAAMPSAAAGQGRAGRSTKRDMVFPPRQVEHVADRAVAIACLAAPVLPICDLRFSEQEEIDVVRRTGVVERGLDHIAGARRLHDMRRYDDDEIGLV